MKTPMGKFRIAEKIGHGRRPADTVFKSSRALSGPAKMLRGDDLVMSRILWLDGVEAHNANTRERYIYIHGTKHEDRLGTPASHGCIRMRNEDVIELFSSWTTTPGS